MATIQKAALGLSSPKARMGHSCERLVKRVQTPTCKPLELLLSLTLLGVQKADKLESIARDARSY